MIGLIILSIGIFIVCANSQLFYDKVFIETKNEEILNFLDKGYELEKDKRIYITLTQLNLDSYAILEVCNINDRKICFKDQVSIEQDRLVQFVKFIPKDIYPQIGHYSLPFSDDQYVLKITSQYNSSFRIMVEETSDDICYQPCKRESFCSRGECICPSGFFGEDCSDQANPISKLIQGQYISNGEYFLSGVDQIKSFQIQTCFDLKRPYIIKCVSVYLFKWSITIKGTEDNILISENETQECFQHNNSYIILKIQDIYSLRIYHQFGSCFNEYFLVGFGKTLLAILYFLILIFILIIGGGCVNALRSEYDTYVQNREKKIKEQKELEKVQKFTPLFLYSQLIQICPTLRNNYSCSICLSEFLINDNVRATHCSHIYHQMCLDLWIQNNKNCPLCRSFIYEKEFQQVRVNYPSQQIELKGDSSHRKSTQPFQHPSRHGVQLVNEIESENQIES